MLLRAQAREKAALGKDEMPFAAAADYLDLVYRFPLSEEAKTGVDKIPYLRLTLGEQFPGTPLETEIARAEALYHARRWKDMRADYEICCRKFRAKRVNAPRCAWRRPTCSPALHRMRWARLRLTDPELDAERSYLLSQIQRTAKDGKRHVCHH